MRTAAILLLVEATTLLQSSRASAARKRASASNLERTAQKACLAGDPDSGIEILAELYVDTNDITYIFNQGRCFEQNRRYEDAIGRFREYLVKGERRLSARDKAVARKHIRMCESYLAKAENDSPPVPAPATVPPLVQTVPVQSKAEPPVAAVVPQPRQPKKEASSGLRIAGIAVGSLGAAALVAGVFFNVKVNSMSSDLEKPDNLNRDKDTSRKNYKTLGWISYGTGAACLLGGSLLYYLAWRSDRYSALAVALVPSLAPEGLGATLTGAF